MTRRKKIIWAPTALRHFSQWIRYIAADSKRNAEKERIRILGAVKRLGRFPYSGRIVPEFNNPGLRELIKAPIRILYRVGDVVQILAFCHEKRRLDLELF